MHPYKENYTIYHLYEIIAYGAFLQMLSVYLIIHLLSFFFIHVAYILSALFVCFHIFFKFGCVNIKCVAVINDESFSVSLMIQKIYCSCECS
jgi:hypothetical protein